MTTTTISIRDFDQDASGARKAASQGPVLLTESGQPSHVLLSYDEYRRLAKIEPSIADLIAMPEAEDIKFDPPKLNITFKIPDLS